MRAEYRLDYQAARSNRFAGTAGPDRVVITLDPDVAAVFNTSEAVNSLLRSVIAALPSVANTEGGAKPRRKAR